eukprot:TRINITY_DN241_c0_g1_i5.p1 TRINITY_DN241_c0_g1~~TRINITY_DN241_c0_g1_i5.p1  ORF type:complete len:726 (+),score=204.17 TRINITY_DN241_c0_g1_i5:218-2395(+)
MYLRFEKYMCVFLFLTALLCSPALVNVNNTGKNNFETAKDDPDTLYYAGFSDWTMTNMDEKDVKLWAHLAVFVLVSCAAWYMVYRYLNDFGDTRKLFKQMEIEHRNASIADHGVLIRGLPLDLRDPNHLHEAIEVMYPGQVQTVAIAHDMPELAKLRVEQMKIRRSLEHARAQLEKDPSTRPEAKTSLLGKKVDAITHFESERDRVDEEIKAEMSRLDHPTTGAALVTFKDSVLSRQMIQNFHFKRGETEIRGESYLPTKWEVYPAPLPDDILWKNLKVKGIQVTIRGLIIFAITMWLVIFWAIPVGILGSLESLATLPGIGGVFEPILSAPPMIVGFLSAYLPTIVLIVFNALLPMILMAFTTIEGVVTISDLHTKTMVKFFTFMLFSVIILPSIFIGSLSKLGRIGSKFGGDPFGETLLMLTAIVAPKSGVFIAFVTQSAFMGVSLGFLRIGPLIVGIIKKKLALTPREIYEADLVGPAALHLQFPILLIMFAISMFFAITMPITPTFGFFFFLNKYLMDKYTVFYINPPLKGSDNRMPPTVIKLVLVIVMGMQIGTTGMFLGKVAIPQTIIGAVFIFISALLFRSITKFTEAIFADDLHVILPPPQGPGINAPDVVAGKFDTAYWHSAMLDKDDFAQPSDGAAMELSEIRVDDNGKGGSDSETTDFRSASESQPPPGKSGPRPVLGSSQPSSEPSGDESSGIPPPPTESPSRSFRPQPHMSS